MNAKGSVLFSSAGDAVNEYEFLSRDERDVPDRGFLAHSLQRCSMMLRWVPG